VKVQVNIFDRKQQRKRLPLSVEAQSDKIRGRSFGVATVFLLIDIKAVLLDQMLEDFVQTQLNRNCRIVE